MESPSRLIAKVLGRAVPLRILPSVPAMSENLQVGDFRLPGGCRAERPGEPDQRKREDQPFRWIEVIPAWAISIIALIGMVIVVISLAERQKRNDPTISAGI
jgi:hypothetical protein